MPSLLGPILKVFKWYDVPSMQYHYDVRVSLTSLIAKEVEDFARVPFEEFEEAVCARLLETLRREVAQLEDTELISEPSDLLRVPPKELQGSHEGSKAQESFY